MKGNKIMPDKEVRNFYHAIHLIEASLNELRQITRDIIPETLIVNGVKDAIFEYCELNQSQLTRINFQFIGEFKRIKKEIEINTFLIFKEIIDNSLNYANPSEILVQILQEPSRLSLIMQDNGNCFNLHASENIHGLGLKKIKSLVENLHGTIDINSQLGIGSEFTIEFSI